MKTKDKMKTLKAGIHEDVESYFNEHWEQHLSSTMRRGNWKGVLKNDLLDIVDKHFEKKQKGN
jgi:hypothetical protein